METVDYTTANAVTKIALTPTIVTSPTLTQAAKLVTTLMVIATMIAGTVAVTKAVAILLSATMVAVIMTATLYADFMMLITSEGIAVISVPIVVMVVSAHTSLSVTSRAELILKYNSEEETTAVAEMTAVTATSSSL